MGSKMVQMSKSPSDEVDEMVRNAELRTELERYYDDSIAQMDFQHIPLAKENQYLEMMLAWEMAPILPIAEWFNPPLRPRRPAGMSEEELRAELWNLIHLLYEKKIVLDFTDHLSDEELYLLICCDILSSREKNLPNREGYLHWDCANVSASQSAWLMYYAMDEEREAWEEMNQEAAPPKRIPPYPRDLPSDDEKN